jgi:flagella basal body P-ring formation protein FlgA
VTPTVPRTILLLLVALVGCLPAVPAQGAVVRLKERVEAQGPVIRLADVAEISDVDPQVVARLGAVTLQPATGKAVRVDFDLVRSRLIAHGVNLAEIEFVGRSSVATPAEARPAPRPATPIPQRVTPPVAVKGPSPQERAQAIVRDAFARRFQSSAQTEDAEYELEVQVRDEDLGAILETQPGAIRFQERALVAGGPQPLTLDLAATPAAAPRQIRVAAWLVMQPRILTVRHALPKDHVLQPLDLQWQKSEKGATGISSLAEAVGRATRKAIRPGEVLQAADLTVVALVRGGDIVSVRVSTPGVVVRRQFKAMSGGGLDEVVNLVALDDARDRIQARVTGFHEAELISTGLADAQPGSTAGPVRFVSETGPSGRGGVQ